MNYLQRLERNIRRNFPEISDEELAERVKLAKGLIALEHLKRNMNTIHKELKRHHA